MMSLQVPLHPRVPRSSVRMVSAYMTVPHFRVGSFYNHKSHIALARFWTSHHQNPQEFRDPLFPPVFVGRGKRLSCRLIGR